MRHSYIEKFDILHPFKSNTLQDVYIGAPKENTKEIVLINVLKSVNEDMEKAKGAMKKSIGNLLHYEEVDQGIVLVTRYMEGVPLLTYLEQEPLSLGSRIHVMFQYLKKITKYDSFPKELKEILIDETQIIIDKGELNLYELILFHEGELEKIANSDAIQKVGKTLKKILEIGAENMDFHRGQYQQIYQFVSELEEGRHTYKNLLSVFHGFKSIYFHGEYRENDDSSRLDNDVSRKSRRGMQDHVIGGKLRGMIIAIAAISIVAYGSLKVLRYTTASKAASQEPVAYFEKIQTKKGFELINKSVLHGDKNTIKESLWEVYKDNQIIEKKGTKDLYIDLKEDGVYHVILKVKDQFDKWSKPYGKDIYVEKQVAMTEDQELATDYTEKLEHLGSWDNPEKNITVDEDVLRSGTYSWKIDKNANKATIHMQELRPDPHVSLSFWIMSSSWENTNIQVEGIFEGSQKFHRKINFKPKEINVWEMIQLPEPMEKVQEVRLIFSDVKESIWIDDIEFSVYK
ncbi:hypothetical protein HNQ80_002110 [Anaerosolibacter carboniphilus]|uniref:Uncharacterized protein n=1 Tax=Anaerosolibacter carboniphilus TaxID=1417629 RepID=A0A841L0W6_9FIRM|nr:hypothetical protein [Anaerosolibacter carboniphilus]MBB6216019.1 hypothetical protein [Anaerosolibacter carboniphilus]